MSDKVRETSGSDQIAAAECPSSRLARPYEGTPPGWNSTKNCRRRIPVSPKRELVRSSSYPVSRATPSPVE